MRDTRMDWLRIGLALLALSFIAVFVQAAANVGSSRRSVLIEGWVEEASFWLGLVFVAGYILDTVYGGRRGR